MALLAAAGGARVARVVSVGSFGNGAGLLVQRRVDGRDLADLDPGQVGAALLTELWRQVQVLHRAGIAHGDLGAGNVVVDDRDLPWLVDFDRAVAGADERLRARDTGDLHRSLVVLVGAQRAEAAAKAARDQAGRDAAQAPEDAGTLRGQA